MRDNHLKTNHIICIEPMNILGNIEMTAFKMVIGLDGSIIMFAFVFCLYLVVIEYLTLKMFKYSSITE